MSKPNFDFEISMNRAAEFLSSLNLASKFSNEQERRFQEEKEQNIKQLHELLKAISSVCISVFFNLKSTCLW